MEATYICFYFRAWYFQERQHIRRVCFTGLSPTACTVTYPSSERTLLRDLWLPVTTDFSLLLDLWTTHSRSYLTAWGNISSLQFPWPYAFLSLLYCWHLILQFLFAFWFCEPRFYSKLCIPHSPPLVLPDFSSAPYFYQKETSHIYIYISICHVKLDILKVKQSNFFLTVPLDDVSSNKVRHKQNTFILSTKNKKEHVWIFNFLKCG